MAQSLQLTDSRWDFVALYRTHFFLSSICQSEQSEFRFVVCFMLTSRFTVRLFLPMLLKLSVLFCDFELWFDSSGNSHSWIFQSSQFFRYVILLTNQSSIILTSSSDSLSSHPCRSININNLQDETCPITVSPKENLTSENISKENLISACAGEQNAWII